MRALLVHSPTAGIKGHDKDSVIDALHLADIKVDYISTKDDGLKRALQDTPDIVVAAGGDGTIGYIFTHLTDRSVPIGIIPLGSANNLARSMGIAGTPAELAEQWRSGHVQPFHLMEIGRDDGKNDLGAEGFGVGLMPALIKRRAKGKKAEGADDIRRGRRALSEALAEAKPLDVEVNIDGKPWKADLLSVDVLNIPFTGPALPFAHGADPSDNVLEVVGLDSDSRDALTDWIERPHEVRPPLNTRRGMNIEVRWRAALSRLDDKIVKSKPNWQQARIRSDREPLRILVPVKHPATKKSVGEAERAEAPFECD
jgi:diacylglycerol kinase (ATP)